MSELNHNLNDSERDISDFTDGGRWSLTVYTKELEEFDIFEISGDFKQRMNL